MAKGKILAISLKSKTRLIKTTVYKKDSCKNVRLFIGIPLSKKTRNELFEYGSTVIDKLNGRCKPVDSKNLHLTIAFLGEVDKANVEKVKGDFLKTELPTSFKVCFKGLGFFPSKDYIKVVWIRLEEAKNVVQIRRAVEKSLKLSKEKKFEPHLTLGRVKFIKNKDYFLKAIEPIKDTKICETEIKEVVLYKSTLTHQGPEYEALCSLQLP